jgi:hypothetical protein
MGKQKHPWLAAKKKGAGDNKAIKFLRSLNPQMKEDDLKLMAELNDSDDLKRMARELGWDDKRIKSDL